MWIILVYIIICNWHNKKIIHLSIIYINFRDLKTIEFDKIYSLDDEIDILNKLSLLNYKSLSGAYLDSKVVKYTDDTSQWFDMGIHSKFGIEKADELKQNNNLTHGQIFKRIFGVTNVKPNIYYETCLLPDLNSSLLKYKLELTH